MVDNFDVSLSSSFIRKKTLQCFFSFFLSPCLPPFLSLSLFSLSLSLTLSSLSLSLSLSPLFSVCPSPLPLPPLPSPPLSLILSLDAYVHIIRCVSREITEFFLHNV